MFRFVHIDRNAEVRRARVYRPGLSRKHSRPMNGRCEIAESSRDSPYDDWSALVNSPNSALFKSDTAQNDIPLWIQ